MVPVSYTHLVKEVLKQAKNADDERSVFIIKNIFQPVYERYINALSDSKDVYKRQYQDCGTGYLQYTRNRSCNYRRHTGYGV